jgi:hypothetical protein
VTPVTQNGVTWYLPVLDSTGKTIIKNDSNLTWLTEDGFGTAPPPDCTDDPDPTDADYSSYAGCKCESNAACTALESYISIPVFIRQAMRDFHMADATMKGIY